MAALSREELARLAAYEMEQAAIRQQLTSGLYWNCRQMMARYAQFAADFQPGGRFESLAEQFAADSEAAITEDEIGELLAAMQSIVSLMEIVEARTPGIFGIPTETA